jgi:putative membrane protein
MNGSWDGGGWGFAMMFMSLVFLACVVGGVLLLARSHSHGEQPPRPSDGSRALDVLDERFARGEIDQAEYEERRRILTSGR